MSNALPLQLNRQINASQFFGQGFQQIDLSNYAKGGTIVVINQSRYEMEVYTSRFEGLPLVVAAFSVRRLKLCDNGTDRFLRFDLLDELATSAEPSDWIRFDYIPVGQYPDLPLIESRNVSVGNQVDVTGTVNAIVENQNLQYGPTFPTTPQLDDIFYNTSFGRFFRAGDIGGSGYWIEQAEQIVTFNRVQFLSPYTMAAATTSLIPSIGMVQKTYSVALARRMVTRLAFRIGISAFNAAAGMSVNLWTGTVAGGANRLIASYPVSTAVVNMVDTYADFFDDDSLGNYFFLRVDKTSTSIAQTYSLDWELWQRLVVPF